MNPENSKTSNPNRVVFNVADKVDSNRTNRNIALSNFIFDYTILGKK